MCDICHRYPCDPRCPNAPEPVAIYECAYCGEGIAVGQTYFNHDGNYYHDNCYHDAATTLAAEENCLTAPDVSDCEDESEIGVCVLCGEPILACEERWVGENVMYHHECFEDNAGKMLKNVALIAEEY